MFGAAAMSISSFLVVTNALRLILLKVNDAWKDKKSAVVALTKDVPNEILKQVVEEEDYQVLGIA